MGKWMTIDNKRNLIQQSYIKPEMTQTSSPSVPPAKGTRPQHCLGHHQERGQNNEGGVWRWEKAKTSKGEGP
ncbi:hypothetical protein PI125_g22454 [Phytophthora idaei]|nr:hypothetical protein PI125_g22454 [Phytophthora idaei]